MQYMKACTCFIFLKHVLGVHRRTTNVAVMGELARYPIIIKSSISNDKLANVAKSKLIERYKAEWMNVLSGNRDNNLKTGKLRTPSLFKYRLFFIY